MINSHVSYEVPFLRGVNAVSAAIWAGIQRVLL